MRRSSRTLGPAAMGAAAVLAACAMPDRPVRLYEAEAFDTARSFSREFVASPADTCNAARRALLSQGYVVTVPQADQLEARKRFQPEPETHVQIEFHVVCSGTARGAPTSVAFASATQDRYALKKTAASASVGVSPFGSISLPFASGSDSLVKVASETIPSGRFYDRFFDLVEHHLAEQMGLDEVVPGDGRSPQPAGASPAPGR